MSYQTVKIYRMADGEKVEKPKWHFVQGMNDMEEGATLCHGDVFGETEDAEYEKREGGKVTCPDCKRMIKNIREAELG